MALWGNNDNVASVGIVTCDYTTTDSDGNIIVNGWNTQFGAVGSAKTGDVIRFGTKLESDPAAVYMGDAVIVSIAGTQQLSIASTAGLSGVAIAGTDFTISELPLYTIVDAHYSEAPAPTGRDADSYVYGASNASITQARTTVYDAAHGGWIGVTTYTDTHGNYRVKTEVLVAAGDDANGLGGISTGNAPLYPLGY